jgi:hypothetical protein
VLDADGLRRLGGDVDLGEALPLEADGEGHQVGVVALGERGDRRGVDAAGEERADGDVGAHVHPHRVVEDVGDAVVERLLLVLGDWPHRELRPEVPPGGQLAVGHAEARAALDPPDAAVQGRGLGHVLQGQVVLHRGAVDATGRVGAAEQLEQRLLLGAERDCTVGQARGEQRLDAERVAGAERRLGLAVPDDEREHAAQPRDDVLAPQVVPGDDRLGVTLRGERGAGGGELLAQFEVVVDLAVEHDPVAPIGVGHRLVAVLDVDERQPVEPEDDPVVPPDLVLVGSPVSHVVQRAADLLDRVVEHPVAVGGQIGEQATHQAQVLGGSGRELGAGGAAVGRGHTRSPARVFRVAVRSA